MVSSRLEQHLVGEVFPTLACRHRTGDAAGRVAEIAVVISRAERIERLLVEMGQNIAAVEAEILEQVAGPGAQAAPMRQQVGERGVLGDVRIVQREGGIEQLRRVVPFDDAVPDQLGDDGRGDRLRHRGQQEHRVGVDGATLAQFARAEALGVNHLVLVDDADSHSGHAGSLHVVCNDAVERPCGLVDGRLGEERRDRHNRRFE